MRSLAIVAITLAGFASPAAAADPAPASKEDKVICKRIQDTATGSHFPVTRKTCMKRSEWKELADGTGRALRDLEDGRLDRNINQPGSGAAPQ